jgi:hypothetical protein
MYHYVYQLTNNEDKRKYIGVRSCKCAIADDKYMSSCKIVSKEYLSNCTKTILKMFSTRKEAVEHEIYLHNKYDVARNPEFFNGAKQTATKFDQSGCIYSSLNPNAKVINIFDHKGNLRMTLNGELTSMKQQDFPNNAFRRSFLNGGQPLGLTKQSRTELRKRLNQYYIGWYALEENAVKKDFIIDFNPEEEQKIGLSSKIKTDSKGTGNPNAKVIDIFYPDGKLWFSTHGNFEEQLKLYGLPRSYAHQAKKTGNPIKTNRIKHKHLNGVTVKIRGEQNDN